jgi:hypothetical protein
MRLLLVAAVVLGNACAASHPGHLSEPSPARVVAQGSAQLTMEVQELI